jgi:hypothetical protein
MRPTIFLSLFSPAWPLGGVSTASVEQQHQFLDPGPGPSGCPSTTLRECSGHGKCVGGRGFCRCDHGYSGSACDRAEYLLACPLNCSFPHGSCLDGYACRCTAGYSGDDCGRHTFVNCTAGCSGHGECLNGACACAPGYHGRYCELGCAGYVRLTGEACSGRGVCRSTGSPGRSADRCVCHIGFEGEGCEVDADGQLGCERGCSGHGSCRHNRCTCELGFAGRDCSILLRYSTLAHSMDAPTTRMLAALVCLVLTALCAICAARYIDRAGAAEAEGAGQQRKMQPVRKGGA